jgi:hypothetical protein
MVKDYNDEPSLNSKDTQRYHGCQVFGFLIFPIAYRLSPSYSL